MLKLNKKNDNNNNKNNNNNNNNNNSNNNMNIRRHLCHQLIIIITIEKVGGTYAITKKNK